MADPLEEVIRAQMKFMFSLKDAEDVSFALHEEKDQNHKALTTLVFRSPTLSENSITDSNTAEHGNSERSDIEDFTKAEQPPLTFDDGSRHLNKKRRLKGQERGYESSDSGNGSQDSDFDQSIFDPHAGSDASNTLPTKARSSIIFPQLESTIKLSATAQQLIDDILINECGRRGRKRRRRSSACSDHDKSDDKNDERMPKWETRRIITGGLSEEWICVSYARRILKIDL